MKAGFLRKILLPVTIIIASAATFCYCQNTDSKKSGSEKNTKKENPDTALSKVISKTASADTSSKKSVEKKEQRKLVVYYLHGTFRCQSCNTIERLTKIAVETGFKEQIKNGRVEIKVINVEENGNEHFVDDYKLYTKSVILSDLKNEKEDKWKNLDQVWTLLHDEGKFVEYIQKEVKSFLEG